MTYWAIATSTKYPDFYVQKIEALNDKEAYEKAEEWNKEHNGFRYTYVVAKEISEEKKAEHPTNECLECGSDLSSGFHNDGCSHNGFYASWPKIDISGKGRHQERVEKALTACIEHVAHDQGGGGAFCDNCKEDLGSDPMNLPKICPGCGRKLVNSGHVFVSPGGSDF
ncbi:MAG: hypothetical protein UW30_C0007G0010 [Candidatus Giovannonibacteria bacterium GW2011_GWA2_44_13b]|uniref:Uncharacterized protein n=2 Tax=Candidatus Giovannoniibacteriota TaxID=1752738 RepID=A0A0G1H4V8_9BACT|nr:MAG: hypothetical protein UW30_C0007G0010 [Candidatus Giovannonibacteria bacterium GW2011_GWA2_44_13b]OGF82609.1 MAG: hypothetical protein A2924_01040 [Candidatus Giovannonibacteria bacterium RIFCSPLOWO2_01_FULL_44_16]